MATSGENADENRAGAGAGDGPPHACTGRLGPGGARVIAPEGRFEGVTLGGGDAPRLPVQAYLTTKLTSLPGT